MTNQVGKEVGDVFRFGMDSWKIVRLVTHDGHEDAVEAYVVRTNRIDKRILGTSDRIYFDRGMPVVRESDIKRSIS
jgi:hypothetical protein